jgi:hypothetical protein
VNRAGSRFLAVCREFARGLSDTVGTQAATVVRVYNGGDTKEFGAAVDTLGVDNEYSWRRMLAGYETLYRLCCVARMGAS